MSAEAPRRRPWAHALGAFSGIGALVVGLGLMVSASQAASNPHLPPFQVPPGDQNFGPILVHNVGRGEVAPSRQLFRVPPLSAYIRGWYTTDAQNQFHAEVYALSGPDPDPVPGNGPTDGKFDAFEVRSVAFGIAPVVVRIQMIQVHDRRGVIEPWALNGAFDGHDDTIRGRVNLAIKQMTLDGHPVTTLRPGCQTAFPAWVQLAAQSGYRPFTGGVFKGTIDVPRFSGCGAGNDRLLTSFISGAGNWLEVTQGSGGGGIPTSPPLDAPR